MTGYERIWLCASAQLADGGEAAPFEVVHQGQPCRAFAVRFEGRVAAFLNRCTHVAMELDWLPNRVFDDTGQWLLCASHGAVFHPATGGCAGGPCNGGLVRLQVHEAEGQVWWQSTAATQPAQGD